MSGPEAPSGIGCESTRHVERPEAVNALRHRHEPSAAKKDVECQLGLALPHSELIRISKPLRVEGRHVGIRKWEASETKRRDLC